MIVWEKGIELIKEVYRITDKLPNEEKLGLVSQMRRASVSVISNISEGEARKTSKEKRRFYEMSRASLVEISLELELINKADIQKLSGLLNECFAMLSKLKLSR